MTSSYKIQIRERNGKVRTKSLSERPLTQEETFLGVLPHSLIDCQGGYLRGARV